MSISKDGHLKRTKTCGGRGGGGSIGGIVGLQSAGVQLTSVDLDFVNLFFWEEG